MWTSPVAFFTLGFHGFPSRLHGKTRIKVYYFIPYRESHNCSLAIEVFFARQQRESISHCFDFLFFCSDFAGRAFFLAPTSFRFLVTTKCFTGRIFAQHPLILYYLSSASLFLILLFEFFCLSLEFFSRWTGGEHEVEGGTDGNFLNQIFIAL